MVICWAQPSYRETTEHLFLLPIHGGRRDETQQKEQMNSSNPTMNSTNASDNRRRRRRRASTTAATVVGAGVAVALLATSSGVVSAARALNLHGESLSLEGVVSVDHGAEDGVMGERGSNDNGVGSDSNVQQRRELKQHVQRTLTAWQSSKSPIRPLDLVLEEPHHDANGDDSNNSGDDDTPRVYQVGSGGFLEPYDLNDYQADFPITLNFRGSNNNYAGDATEKVEGGDNAGATMGGVTHVTSDRLGLTNFDLKRLVRDETDGYVENGRQLRGLHNGEGVEVGGAGGIDIIDKEELRRSIFVYSQHNDPEEVYAQQVNAIHDDRDLEYYDLSSYHRGGDAKYHASNVQDVTDTTQTTEESTAQQQSYAATWFKKSSSSTTTKDTTPPVIRATFPPPSTKIGPNQSFGALVSDNGSGVENVCLQFRDHLNSRSTCFDLMNVGAEEGNSDVWELSFDGFDAYEGETWSYRIRSKDGAKNRKFTDWADFIININGREESTTTTSTTTVASTQATPERTTTTEVPEVEQAPPVPLLETVRDENWPYGGIVQTSTGRLLFFFDGNAYVCTGTVLQDDLEDRTIILTAGEYT